MINILLNYKKKIVLSSNPFIKTVFSHAPKYFISSFISALIGLMMTKFYTHVFDPKEFGILSLYATFVSYFGNFIAFSIDSASQRCYFDYNNKKERPEFLGTMIIAMTLSAFFWCIVFVMLRRPIVNYLGGTEALYFFSIFLVVTSMYLNFTNRISYNEQLSNLVFQQGMLQTFINHFTSFIFIYFYKIGILARQYGQNLATAINLFFYTKELRKRDLLKIKYKFRFDMLKRVLHFSMPAFFTTVITTSFSYLDRIFLNAYHGAAQVGIYSLGYSLGQSISMVFEAVSMAIFPTIMNELKKNPEVNIKKLKKFDMAFCGILILIGFITFIFKDLIIVIVSNEKYKGSGNVIPFVMFSFIMGGMYKTPSSILSFYNIVWFYPIISALSFAINALFNFLLIPKYSELGAAYATFLGTFFYSIFIQLFASKYLYSKKYICLVYSTIFIFITLMFLLFI